MSSGRDGVCGGGVGIVAVFAAPDMRQICITTFQGEEVSQATYSRMLSDESRDHVHNYGASTACKQDGEHSALIG